MNIFCAHGYHVDVRVTQRQLDAKIYVEKYGFAYDRIVCSGGDGTINEVITGMMELDEKPILGYIPAGSTNDFSNGMYFVKISDETDLDFEDSLKFIENFDDPKEKNLLLFFKIIVKNNIIE